MSQIAIRAARQDDIPVLLGLVNAAGAGLPIHAWQHSCRDGQSPWDRGRELMLDERTDIHLGNAWIAQTPAGGFGGMVLYVPPRTTDPALDAAVPFLAPLLELEAEAAGTAHIAYICTLDGWRGQGIGSAMMRFSESFRGRNGMSVVVSSANRSARSLYERFGYSERSRRSFLLPNGQRNGDDWVLMCKR